MPFKYFVSLKPVNYEGHMDVKESVETESPSLSVQIVDERTLAPCASESLFTNRDLIFSS